MLPRVKFGLIVGAVALVLNVFVSTAFGLCGPFTALLAGGISGFFTAQQEKLPLKGDGARAGVISGLVAGGLVFLGQLLGALGAILLVQSLGGKTIFGQVPDLTAGPQSVAYIVAALGTGACFGVVGIALAAGAGALAGYLSTPVARPVDAP